MYIVHYLVPAKKVFEPIILLWTNHAVIFTVATQKSCKFLFLIIFRMDNLFIYSLGGITVWQVSPQEILADDVVYIVYKRQDMSFCDVMSEYNLVLQTRISQWDCVPLFVTIALCLGYPILAVCLKYSQLSNWLVWEAWYNGWQGCLHDYHGCCNVASFRHNVRTQADKLLASSRNLSGSIKEDWARWCLSQHWHPKI